MKILFMKILKTIIIWSVLALLLQSCTFFMLNKYYQKTLLNTKVKEEIVKKPKKVVQNISIKIPTTANRIQTSFDGKYISYYNNSKLIVVNYYTGKLKIVGVENYSQLIYSKWQPDVDSMLLCERDLNRKTTINVFTYNAETNKEQAPTDTNNKEIKFTIANSKNTISDIQMSPIMQIFYIKSARNNSKSDVFNNTVNGNTVRIFTSKYIGKIATFQYKSNLIYEDTSTNLIKVTNTVWSLGKIKACLFNTDSEDNIYIGALQDGKVYKIMYGSIDESVDKWTSIALNSPVDKECISITKSGAIYIDNSLEGYVINQVSKKKTSYVGSFLEITDNKLISIDNEIIKIVDLP